MASELTVQEIKDRLRLRREELGFTRNTVANKADMPDGYLTKLERGEHKPKRVTLERLALVLDCSVEWLIDG